MHLIGVVSHREGKRAGPPAGAWAIPHGSGTSHEKPGEADGSGRAGEFYRRALQLLDSAEVRLREKERAARWRLPA